MMKRTLLALLALALAGCAQQPVQSGTEQSDAQNRARIHTELGAAYYESGQLGVALEELNEALRIDAGYAPAYNMMGLVYMELREDSAAQQNFEKALRINPLDSDANNNYGWFLCRKNQERESIRYFLAALKNPLYATPDKSYVNAGVCSLRSGNEKDAEEFFKKALLLRPSQPQALFNLAEMAFKRNRLDEARSHLTRYMQSANPSAESLWLGVRLERRLGDRDAEASYGLQLRKRFPDSPETKSLLNGQFE